MLIAIEGLDQSGKATQTERLAQYLASLGKLTVTWSFPAYWTPTGRLIERILNSNAPHDPTTMQLLFTANRCELRETINERLANGEVVICDRYTASGVAYGEAQGINPDWLETIQEPMPKPDLTILIDIEPGYAETRKPENRDRYERDLPMLVRTRESYERQANENGWIIVDGTQSPDEVEAAIQAEIKRRSPEPAG